ncbi:MAG TPA: tetratricopeptide repeat protein [Steroidobacteraceae bacterium]|nr:tetratricopeptide repeat protein [Steroidobacteraceae bacterium]
MTESSRKSLDEIVREAQTLPPEQRARYIREACATAQVELTSAGGTGSHDESAPGSWPGDEVIATPVDPAGERIGPYRIVRSLGQGGMGEVFLAERADDQFAQQVALKLVRRGLLSRQVQSRLRLERQILATLDHPNIARLFDGGTTTDGTPYIVMEYVEGDPIDIYCDRNALTLQERLKLFQTVCSAVHRAHQNLIVHRDLKPSNILVTHAGAPKLLDFGIAKMLDQRPSMHTLAVTHADYRVLTPDHASPEQIRGELITTASDIYVLGVLLYELLCGYRPFSLKGNRLAELERAICEQDAAPPSAAISAAIATKDADVQRIAAARAVTPAKLRRELRGDLDNIVSMAMRKEPQRRYSSVEQFAADVERFLCGLPILARADSRAYRLTKFVRRHSVVVSLSVAFIVLLIGSTIMTLVQSHRIGLERDVAQAQRAAAQSERERAQAVAGFLIDSFRLADPSRARGNQITAKEILDTGAARIGRELRGQPALQATLLDTIGGVYLSLDRPTEAQPLIEQALAIRRTLFGQNSLDVAQSLHNLNRVYEQQGDFRSAETLAQQALAIRRTVSGAQSIETAVSLCQLGSLKLQQGELATAETFFQECLSIRSARLGPDNEAVTAPLDNLARLAQARNDFDTAERLYRRAVEIDLRARGEDHPQYIRHLHNLATVLHARGDLAAAEPAYRRSIELYRRVLGPEHGETIDAMSNMGSFLLDQGKNAEARSTFETTLALNRKVRGVHHVYVGYDLMNLGRLDLKEHDLASAERRLDAALAIYRAELPPTHSYIATTGTLLGRVYLEQGRVRDAERVLLQALDSRKQQYGEKSTQFAITNAFLGRVWALQRRYADAERALTESYPLILASPRVSDRENAATVRGWLESLYASTGRSDEARAYFAKVDARR